MLELEHRCDYHRCLGICSNILNRIYLLVDCTFPRMWDTCFASLATVYESVLTFWQSDLKCRLKGNLSGRMKTCAGLDGPQTMAVSLDYISGRLH